VTESASVQALPATPTLAVSASTVCVGTSITFRVTNPVSGATYTWSGAAGTASGTGDGTYTVSGATTGVKSVTAYARLTSNGTTCQSGNASLSAYVSQPGANGQSSSPCGCASSLKDCNGTCQTSCTIFTLCDGITEVHTENINGSGRCSIISLREQCARVLGAGWRQPTADELKCLCQHKDQVPGGLEGGYYAAYTTGNTCSKPMPVVDVPSCNEYADQYSSYKLRCVK
jgi:hypothetical protein